MTYRHNLDLRAPSMVIPHRHPHLWLHGIEELDLENGRAAGFWTPGQEHYFGHFEGLALLPNVKQIESIAQLGAYVVLSSSQTPEISVLKAIEQASFERSVRRGETLELSVQIVDRDKQLFKGCGAAMVGGEIACRTSFVSELLASKDAKGTIVQPHS